MKCPRYIGQRVVIEWGRCKGREAVIVAISQECPGMVVAEYQARVDEPEVGIVAGANPERVKVFLHWSQTKPLKRTTRRV